MSHTAKVRLQVVSLLLLLVAAAGFSPASAQANSGLQIPISGTFTDALGGVGHLTGNFTLQRFALQNGALVAVGTLTGTLTDSVGNVVGNIVRTITLPLLGTATQASCEILHLELGPLDLDLLGLVVHLDRVVLDISAEPGAGNLLGNLLCAVANLLNGGGNLNGLATLLNQILRIL